MPTELTTSKEKKEEENKVQLQSRTKRLPPIIYPPSETLKPKVVVTRPVKQDKTRGGVVAGIRDKMSETQDKTSTPASTPGTSRKAGTSVEAESKIPVVMVVDEATKRNENVKKVETEAPKKPSLFKSKIAAAVAAANSEEQSSPSVPKPTLKSVAKRVNRQIKAMTMIKRWTEMTSHSQFANDADHLQYMRNIAKYSAIDLPDPLVANVMEEVLAILPDTLKQYRMELGANHQLTQEMQGRIQAMKEQVGNCAPRDTRREGNFFSVFTE
uniref:Uncharacterized protein n=1 Tax=Ciona savignyi TaxID=51511 RepID=H2YWX5_CIOSA